MWSSRDEVGRGSFFLPVMPVVPQHSLDDAHRVATHVTATSPLRTLLLGRAHLPHLCATCPMDATSTAVLVTRPPCGALQLHCFSESLQLRRFLCRPVCILEAPCPQPFKPRGPWLGCRACRPICGKRAPVRVAPKEDGAVCGPVGPVTTALQGHEPPSRAGLGFHLAVFLFSSCKRS